MITERLLADLAPLDDRLWLVVDDVHELGAEWANKAAAVREPRPRGHSATVSSLVTHSG